MTLRKKNITPLLSQLAIGQQIKKLRQAAGLNQGQLGKILDMQQSGISRIESGEHALLASHLYLLSRYFDVDSNDILNGTFNTWKVAENFGREPRIPMRYKGQKLARMREILPLILFLNLKKGTQYTQSVLAKMGMEPVLYLGPDEEISINCLIDLVKHIVEEKIITKKNFDVFIDLTRVQETQGFMHAIYSAQVSGLEIIRTYASYSHHYERYFNYHFLPDNPRKFALRLDPNEGIQSIEIGDSKVEKFLCHYKEGFLSNLPKYIGQDPFGVTQEKCFFRGDGYTLYRFAS